MTLLLILSLVLIGIFVASVPLYRILLHQYSPRRYRQLKTEGRFANMPDTWEELWRLWTEPQGDIVKKMSSMAGLEDPRVLYGRFVDKNLMPVPYLRMICTFAGMIGFVLLVIYGLIAAIR